MAPPECHWEGLCRCLSRGAWGGLATAPSLVEAGRLDAIAVCVPAPLDTADEIGLEDFVVLETRESAWVCRPGCQLPTVWHFVECSAQDDCSTCASLLPWFRRQRDNKNRFFLAAPNASNLLTALIEFAVKGHTAASMPAMAFCDLVAAIGLPPPAFCAYCRRFVWNCWRPKKDSVRCDLCNDSALLLFGEEDSVLGSQATTAWAPNDPDNDTISTSCCRSLKGSEGESTTGAPDSARYSLPAKTQVLLRCFYRPGSVYWQEATSDSKQTSVETSPIMKQPLPQVSEDTPLMALLPSERSDEEMTTGIPAPPVPEARPELSIPRIQSGPKVGTCESFQRPTPRDMGTCTTNDTGPPIEKFWKTRMCKQYHYKLCKRSSEECRFAHSLQELRHTDDVYKTKLCEFHGKGGCKAGKECRHAHGEAELRERRIPAGQVVGNALRYRVRNQRPPPPPRMPLSQQPEFDYSSPMETSEAPVWSQLLRSLEACGYLTNTGDGIDPDLPAANDLPNQLSALAWLNMAYL
eukprot:Protomagalhaensia_sp_Gyna_25__2251@NODE_222_length_4314_cov_33_908070_g173_i0_p1_GENE_NODE_222_length_4314_cov_33_908070_g173_i0NODE_222_length_4314_cov_33_908070_g173_i0_p1_ORF_typecomplete_len522_score47_16zfCCCH/PF00642_24/0_0051zfCCCH/PF00642_24/0_0024zfCCCH_3/PF15663_5/0_99zfCCCH_3/PF15663_5/0_066Torus/PF16131_5/1_5e02Torus/PF16131_5/11_NODE_222_length_4314_cov_33_908070_g173_i027294294